MRRVIAPGRRRDLLGLLLCVVLLNNGTALGQVRLPRLVSDGMVLQRNVPVRLWGWAGAGEKIALTFKGKTYAAAANPAGEWAVRLDPMPAGGPYRPEIEAGNRITIENILVGEVWVCAGREPIHPLLLVAHPI